MCLFQKQTADTLRPPMELSASETQNLRPFGVDQSEEIMIRIMSRSVSKNFSQIQKLNHNPIYEEELESFHKKSTRSKPHKNVPAE